MSAILGNGSVTFGDSTVQSTAAISATTTNVLSATASASVGGVGTYGRFWDTSFVSSVLPGTTVAGSILRYAGVGGPYSYPINSGTSPSGTWRLMGYLQGSCPCGGTSATTSLFLRIS